MIDKLLNRMGILMWMAIAVTALFPLTALGAKFGFWHFRSAFSLLMGLSVTGAVLLALVGFGLIASISAGNQKAKHAATAAVLILILPLAYVFANVYKARSLPVIHDISTDMENPPQFIHAGEIRGAVENSLEWSPETVALQQQAYPNIGSVYLPMDTNKAWQLIEQTIMNLPWEITYHNKEKGIFEATATSFWFGFVDDIIIRVTADGDKSRIDIRSLSRVGKSDLGKNAQRIRYFSQALLRMAPN